MTEEQMLAAIAALPDAELLQASKITDTIGSDTFYSARTVAKLLREREMTMERLRVGFDRYETARRMSPQQWVDAWKLNLSTGKPFDEIVDNLKPFLRPST